MGNKCFRGGTAVVANEDMSTSSTINFSPSRRRSSTRSFRDSINVNLQWNKLNVEKGRREKEVYEILEKIGEGSISTVSKIRKKNPGGSGHTKHRCMKHGSVLKSVRRVSPLRIRKSDTNKKKIGMHFALKKVDLTTKGRGYLDEIRNEINILKSLDHPNILKAFETFEKKKHISIVMELCDGGDLKSREPYNEREAAAISNKILSAVAHMHEHNIIHRDLKFENIMYESNRLDAEIKIIDFGLSKQLKNSAHRMTDKVGTTYTMAPEVLKGDYTLKADIWSVGVISYMLLSGQEPFPGKDSQEIEKKILKGKYNFNHETWSEISDLAKDFVSCLLHKYPTKRLSAREAHKHDWLESEHGFGDWNFKKSMLEKVSNNLIRYSLANDFKKLALNIIAHKLRAADVSKLRLVFDHFDSDNDGTITYDEFESVLLEYDYTEVEINEIFRNVNINNNGAICHTEFLAATIETQGCIDEGRLAEAFDRLDCDNSGYISKKNLCTILENPCLEDKLSRLIEQVDLDGDGKVSYTEFLNQFQSGKNEDSYKRRSSLNSKFSMASEDGFDLDG